MKRAILIFVLVYFIIGLLLSYSTAHSFAEFSKVEAFALGFTDGKNIRIISYWPLYILLGRTDGDNIFNVRVNPCINIDHSNSYINLVLEYDYLTRYSYSAETNSCKVGWTFRSKLDCYLTCAKKPFPLNLLSSPPNID